MLSLRVASLVYRRSLSEAEAGGGTEPLHRQPMTFSSWRRRRTSHPRGYQRFSRCDGIGPFWLPRGRLGLEGPASIQSPGGSATVYRRHNKLGPVVDNLNELK